MTSNVRVPESYGEIRALRGLFGTFCYSTAGASFVSAVARGAPVQTAISLSTERSRPETAPDALRGRSTDLVWARTGAHF